MIKDNLEKKVRKNKMKTMLIIMVLLCAVFFIIFFKTDFFDVKHINVEGNVFLSNEEVIIDSGITLGNNIFKEKIKMIEDNLLKNPYIKSVELNRKLPNKIVIKIVERKEAAAIPFMGVYIYIDREGMVLRSSETLNGLKAVKGLEFDNFVEGEKLKVKDREQLGNALRIVNGLDSQQIDILELDVTDKDNVIIRLTDTLLCRVGIGNHFDYKLQVLNEILLDIKEKDITRGVIDIRYDGHSSFRPVE
ncbi:MAG: cell division protein FtsQ/DivIB [Bacillota bacterium]